MAGESPHICSLEAAVGKLEACPAGDCPFWEPGGAVLAGSAESTAGADAARTLFSHLLGGLAE